MREFRRPRWILLSVFVLVFAIICVTLGFWQLSRLQERRDQNAIVESRLSRAPVSISELETAMEPVEGVRPDPTDLEFTLVTAEGTFLEAGRVRVRSQVANGQAGVHAVYPFDLGAGRAVLVNVGWYPLEADPPPIEALHGDSKIEITGFVRASQIKPTFGREEPTGPLDRVSRVDVERIQEQVDVALLPVWIQLISPDDPTTLPIPSEPPQLDEGSHFSYAVQWFSFALIGVVGYAALVRKEVMRIRRAADRRGAQDPPQTVRSEVG